MNEVRSKTFTFSPNKSRMVETWKKSGWEYKFYDDKDAEAFLSLHFPAEVTEAFHAILPGAYKADLFRYCVLFIYGGVYADVDTILESSLDSAILSDTGFMIGLDSVRSLRSTVFIKIPASHLSDTNNIFIARY